MGWAARANPRAQAAKRGELPATPPRPRRWLWPQLSALGDLQAEQRAMFSRFVSFALFNRRRR